MGGTLSEYVVDLTLAAAAHYLLLLSADAVKPPLLVPFSVCDSSALCCLFPALTDFLLLLFPLLPRSLLAKSAPLTGVKTTPTDFTNSLKRFNVYPIETRTAAPGVFDSIGISRLCGPPAMAQASTCLVHGKITASGAQPLSLTIRTVDAAFSAAVHSTLESNLR